MSLGFDPAVRRDLNAVRRAFARRNPRNLAAPLLVKVGDAPPARYDLLPLYFVSPVIRELLDDLPSRPDHDAHVLEVEGDVSVHVWGMFLDYGHGSGHGKNWAADLDEAGSREGGVSAWVWELAAFYKVHTLEKLVRKTAFGPSGLNFSTCAMLMLRAKEDRLDDMYEVAFRFMCYKLEECTRSGHFVYLSFKDIRGVIQSVHLRATQDQKYKAICAWQIGWPGMGAREAESRAANYYGLFGSIMFSFITDPGALAMRTYALGGAVNEGKLAPSEPVFEKEGKKYYFAGFSLKHQKPILNQSGEFELDSPSLLEVAHRRDTELKGREWEVPTPRFVGEFKAFNYYWQLECPWYSADEGGFAKMGMGAYLRLRHGTDMAGLAVRGNVVGLEVEYRFRLHCATNFKKCYKMSAPFREDMLNVKGQKTMYGLKRFLEAKECKKFLDAYKKDDPLAMPHLHVSIEIRRVEEITAPEVY